MNTASTTDRRGARRLAVIIALTVAVPVLGVAGIVGYYKVSGKPLIDEWHCSKGEAPYFYEEGGSACAPEGGTLPEGAEWDPFGNRPFSCSDRWGWTKVVPTDRQDDPVATVPTDCVKDGEPIPDGWTKVE